jgi:flagellar biogenesis protein FliO
VSAVRGRHLFAAIALAIGAIVLTPPVGAQQDPPPDTSVAPAASTPLALRPGKPLALAPEPPHSSLGWKVLACLAILGGAAFYMRKRLKPRQLDDGQLTIVRRAPIGIRSELLVVQVEGQRLLIGVTPHAIQSLAVLDSDDEAASRVAEALAPTGSVVGERFTAMLQAADARTPGHRPEVSPAVDEASLAGQARGLLALRRRG